MPRLGSFESSSDMRMGSSYERSYSPPRRDDTRHSDVLASRLARESINQTSRPRIDEVGEPRRFGGSIPTSDDLFRRPGFASDPRPQQRAPDVPNYLREPVHHREAAPASQGWGSYVANVFSHFITHPHVHADTPGSHEAPPRSRPEADYPQVPKNPKHTC